MNIRQLKKEREKLAAHIEKSRQDLVALDRVIQMFGGKESAGGDANNGTSVEAGVTPSLLPAAAPGEDTGADSEGGDTSSVWLKPLVKKALDALSGDFTKSQVFDKMIELSPENKDRIRADVVSAVVWRMANRTKELETVTVGKGSKPSVYRKKA